MRVLIFFAVGSLLLIQRLHAQTLTDIGVTQLRAAQPALIGTGVYVAQPEALESSPNGFEVNPLAAGQPQSLFTYINSTGATATVFPNAVGSASGHAGTVAQAFYGATNGVAPGVQHVDNYNANYFVNSLIATDTAIPAKVVNQSFAASTQNAALDQVYDDYVADHGTIFVSGVANGGGPKSPATSYNGIGVAAIHLTGASPAFSSVGPTTDGRSKPDITAPADFTSFSTPLVAGAAAVLVQAGTREDGGVGTAADATDPRTVKALLLNGAVKQFNSPNLPAWTHTSTAPLDRYQGAGVLNVFNSYNQLAGGEHAFTLANTSLTPLVSGSVGVLEGWNFDTSLTSSATSNAVHHYAFDLLGMGSAFTLTSTLVWERQAGQSSINNLDLFLYTAGGTLVDSSVSTVDNVEHLFTKNLAPALYDLEVVKHFGTPGVSDVSDGETYALAFDFVPLPEPTTFFTPILLAAGLLARRNRRESRRLVLA